MPVQVTMPILGESVIEGTVMKWLKAKGDQVAEFEPLLEINTDKVDSEIPSPSSGILLDILVPEGKTVTAGTPLAWIGSEGELPAAISELSPAAITIVETPGVLPPARSLPAAAQERDLGFISPVVAKIAQEQQVDLYQVNGTGQGGRITKKDILSYLEQRSTQLDEATESLAFSGKSAAQKPFASTQAELVAKALPGEVLPLNVVRRAIADHMVLSKRTSPHVTTVMEADLSQVVAHRAANKEPIERSGVNLTYTAYFVAAVVQGLKAHPLVNSSWTDEGILLHREINVGLAASLGDEGLIVPVIKNADGLSLIGLARTINDLASRARSRQLKPDEVRSGTFTITNHGISGSLFATPIINQPQCAILGVGAIQKRVVVVSDGRGDTIAIRPMVYLTLTFDHRILDGAVADDFLNTVVKSLQNWS